MMNKLSDIITLCQTNNSIVSKIGYYIIHNIQPRAFNIPRAKDISHELRHCTGAQNSAGEKTSAWVEIYKMVVSAVQMVSADF